MLLFEVSVQKNISGSLSIKGLSVRFGIPYLGASLDRVS